MPRLWLTIVLAALLPMSRILARFRVSHWPAHLAAGPATGSDIWRFSARP